MKLSEAILLGSVGSTQAIGFTYNETGARCAHGAALLAVGRPKSEYVESMSVWPWTTEQYLPCPVCGDAAMVFSIIRCLNDNHHWSRPRIAEWVATIEPAEIEPCTEVLPQPEFAKEGV